MKKILIPILICVILILGGSTALAEGGENMTDDSQVINGVQSLEDLFDKYNLMEKQAYLILKSNHQSFHDGRKNTKTETIQYYADQMSAITGQVSDGTLSTQEGAKKLKSLRNEIATLRNEIQIIRDQQQIESNSIKTDIVAVRELIKSALQEDEVVSSQIATYLEQLNNLFEKHLEMDYKYADMIDSLLPTY